MKVNAYVYVHTPSGSVLLRPGDTVPDGVTVTNPAAIDGEHDAPEVEAPEVEAPEAPEAEPETPAEPESDPAPRKRTSRKTAPASE